jgi:hypothetical protein
MDDKIVTLDAFYDPMLAEIIRTRLEANNIPCFIADNNIIGANPLYNQAMGGVKIKVFEHDVEKCREILSQSEELALIDDIIDQSETTCPHCKSSNVRYGAATHVKTNWFFSLISFLLATYPFPRKAWHCFNCGKDFE